MKTEEIEHISRIINDCNEAKNARNSPFSSWDKEFLESIEEQWTEKKWLSPKQIETLEDIWDKI